MLRMLGIVAAVQFAGVARAEDVAQVLAVDGTVNIARASGAVVPADPRVSLDRGDTVQTGEDGAVILMLSNSRLVRVDEDLELKVGDIALLGSPKTVVPPAQQLDALLYPGERERMRGIDDAERIAGWQARLSAATAIPAQREARLAGGSMLAPSGLAASPPPAPPPPADDAPEPPPPPEDVATDDKSSDVAQTETDAIAMSSAPKPQSAAVPPGEPAPERLAKDDIAAMFAKGGALYACGKEWRKATGLPAGTEALLVFRLSGKGTINRVVGDRGLAPPMCVRERFEGLSSIGQYVFIEGADGADAVSVSIALP